MKSVAINKIIAKVKPLIAKLSPSEKRLILIGIAVLFSLGAYSVFTPITEAFARQSAELEALTKAEEGVVPHLERYQKLLAKKSAVEQRYKELEFKEGEVSFLEKLVQDRAKIPFGRYTIRPGKEQDFGKAFKLLQFSVKFDTSSLETLIAFLSELVQGERPLIISRLDVKKNPVTNILAVDLDVRSIRQQS